MSQVHHSVVLNVTCCGFTPSPLLDKFLLKEFSHPLNTSIEKNMVIIISFCSDSNIVQYYVIFLTQSHALFQYIGTLCSL